VGAWHVTHAGLPLSFFIALRGEVEAAGKANFDRKKYV